MLPENAQQIVDSFKNKIKQSRGKRITRKVRFLIRDFGFYNRTEERTNEITNLFSENGITLNPSILKSNDKWVLGPDDNTYLTLDLGADDGVSIPSFNLEDFDLDLDRDSDNLTSNDSNDADSNNASFNYMLERIFFGDTPIETSGFFNKIPRYKVIKEIGEGGFGTVYLASDAKLNRQVAVKVLKIKNEDIKNNWLNEAKIISQFNNQFIVRIYDVIDDNDFPAIIMEYYSGDTLKSRIENNIIPFDNDRAIKNLVKNISCGLIDIHRQEIIHHDLGPHNIIFHKDGTPKICDFGIAHPITGNPIGFHPIFHPPQEFSFLSNDNPYAYDIYTLGQTIVSCWTGIHNEPIRRENLPNGKNLDGLLWSLVWFMLSPTQESTPSAKEIYELLSSAG